jgi:hypothetical protein
MMHAVVRRSGKKVFQYAKLVYCFGVYKSAPTLGQNIDQPNVNRSVTDNSQWDKKEKFLDGFKYRGPEPNGKIELFRRMMMNVPCPKYPDAVIHTMHQPIGKIFQ